MARRLMPADAQRYGPRVPTRATQSRRWSVRYENPRADNEWEPLANLLGTGEGDMTRFAIARREPLVVEWERFLGSVGARGFRPRTGATASRRSRALGPSSGPARCTSRWLRWRRPPPRRGR